ncbi:MAG: alpha-D-ribose 1-methylphosphonate 5-triphosphate diphosphatase [Slackia sp.]|nr:alpha-D-ribose 1-methylphosphonate 5-triphosphate diphosphatase [Slackia sp.]
MISSDTCSMIVRGGAVVRPDCVLENHDVIVRDGMIEAIVPTSSASAAVRPVYFAHSDDTGTPGFDVDVATGLPVVDARGAYVAPGMIDIHSDYIENIASPRPSVVMDLPTSLYKCDRELVGHGITTIFHSLSVMGNDEFKPKPIRHFENVSALLSSIRAMRAGEERDHLIRHRMHLRIELDATKRYEEIAGYIERGDVDLISFMDHTPGQGQYRDLLVYAETVRGYHDEGMSDEQVAAAVRMRTECEKLSLEQLERLARAARDRSVRIASHDDDSAEKLDVMEMLGACVSEFPIDMQTALDARRRGMTTLAGAPNVMMGRSHSGNLSAREAIASGAIDALCSDYYPAAMLTAVFLLHDECGVSLSDAFALVTCNPARAVGIDDTLGSIEVGKRADILVVREIGCGTGGVMPVVTRAFVGGHSVYRTHYPSQPFGYGASARVAASVRDDAKSREEF